MAPWQCPVCGNSNVDPLNVCGSCGEPPQRGKYAPAIKDPTKHPGHYGGDVVYEVWKCYEAWGLVDDHYLCSAIEYIARHRSKDGLKDLKKARAFLDRRIAREENGFDKNGVTIAS